MIRKFIIAFGSIMSSYGVTAAHLDDQALIRLRQDSTTTNSDDKYNFNSSIAENFAHYDAFLIGFKSS